MYLIEGIPLTNIPRSEGLTFSYFHDSPIKRGSIAKAPIGRRDVGLLVLSADEVSPRKTELKKASFKLRPLKKGISIGQISEPTIVFIEWLTRYYYASSGQFARLIIPDYIQKKIDLQMPQFEQYVGEEFTFSYEQSPLRFALYVKSIEETHNKSLQTLVLFPEAIHAEQFYDRLPEDIRARTLLWRRPTSAKNEYLLHLKILSGEVRTVIGTRSASLLQIPNLALIIVEGEDNDAHKSWDARPKYDARTISMWRASTYHLPLVCGSDLPSVSSYARIVERGENPDLKATGSEARVHIVDMKTEREQGNQGPLSERLKKEISRIRDQQVLLLVSRRGEFTVVVCSSCGKPSLCPVCGSVLISHSNRDDLYCRFCPRNLPIKEACEHCSGTHFIKLGSGTQKIEHEVKSLFPHLTVERLDADTAISPKKVRDVIDSFNRQKIDVLVGTQMIVKPHVLHPVHLAAIVDIDTLFHIPEYDAEERAMRDAFKVLSMAQSTFIWQTNVPDHNVVYAVVSGESQQTLENIYERRKKYGWPPSVQLIQLTLRGRRTETGSDKAHALYQKLSRVVFSGVNVYPPLSLRAIKGSHSIQRILLSFEKTVPITKRNELLDYVPSDWDIDVDPVSTIN